MEKTRCLLKGGHLEKHEAVQTNSEKEREIEAE